MEALISIITVILVLLALFVYPTLAVILVGIFILYNVIKFICEWREWGIKGILPSILFNLIPAIGGIAILIWAFIPK